MPLGQWTVVHVSTGVWFVGARGNIATTAMVGAHAVAHGAASRDGMVTARPPLSALDLPEVEDLVFGGHDIRTGSVVASAERLCERNGVPDREVLNAVRGGTSKG